MERRKWIDDSSITDPDTDWMDPTGDGSQEKSYVSIMNYIRSRLNASGENIVSNLPEYWDSQRDLVAKKNTIYVYADKFTGESGYVPGVKIGDGTSFLIDMPFVADDVREQLMNHIQNTSMHVSSNDRQNWNGKVSVKVVQNNLIFEN